MTTVTLATFNDTITVELDYDEATLACEVLRVINASDTTASATLTIGNRSFPTTADPQTTSVTPLYDVTWGGDWSVQSQSPAA